ncbi:hypothetical protein NE237_012335 [Protea cynaroides]|uniref:D-isomer specific 2-hydroxyacid dehydrogenase NAD-binding domain-containing protein n=1 Tax=Protea cynaroides TaxID=273540 RepID=A0A9Q0GWP3_9MAGN|nr:hypothetical protein NE237_012335 [Protea cynaroides]
MFSSFLGQSFLALTKKTYHIIDTDVLLAMGERGVIINVGRGALIDEKELVRCLVQGEIGGAGLDVYENEPDVPKELLVLDNVVPSPHMAVMTPESFAASGKWLRPTWRLSLQVHYSQVILPRDNLEAPSQGVPNVNSPIPTLLIWSGSALSWNYLNSPIPTLLIWSGSALSWNYFQYFHDQIGHWTSFNYSPW